MKRADLCALFASVLLTGCFSGYSETPPPGELRVRKGDLASDLVLSGELEAARREVLSTTVADARPDSRMRYQTASSKPLAASR